MYLSRRDLTHKSREWCRVLGVRPESPVELIDPGLLVVDMQNDFLIPRGLLRLWGGGAIVPNVVRLSDAFRVSGRPVYLTRHAYEDPEVDGGLTARWWGSRRGPMLLREGTWHSEIHNLILTGPQDRVIVKRRYSAFLGTELDMLLRRAGVRDLVIAGVATDICCLATALDAFSRDYNTLVVLDATGGTSEAAHLFALQNVASCCGVLAATGQLVKSLGC